MNEPGSPESPEQGKLGFDQPAEGSVKGGEKVDSDKRVSEERFVYGPKPGEIYDDRPTDVHNAINELRRQRDRQRLAKSTSLPKKR